MKILVRTIIESIRLAFQQLRSNKLRSFLSLLGITIGIFCIIAVQSAVGSLQTSIKDGFGEMGSDVVVVDVMPWAEDPGDNYWKYFRRPSPSYDEYEALRKRLKQAKEVAYSIFVMGKTIKYKSSSVQGAFLMGTTYEYPEIQPAQLGKGRYFTRKEYEKGENKVILGNKIAQELFENIDPLQKYIKIFGQKFQVIGTIKEEGDNPINFFNYDEAIWMGYHTANRYVNTKGKDRFSVGKLIYARTKDGVTTAELTDEIIGKLRAIRRLHPREDQNFSMNEISMLNDLIDKVFGSVNIAGWIIGGFALLVGLISVANIMFVSVKERTNIIGIKKALGAKRNVILLEFLIEAIILCIIGGLMGLALVFGIMKILSSVFPLNFWLSNQNLILGVGVSVIVGLIAGAIPAMQASKLDPVEAMRG